MITRTLSGLSLTAALGLALALSPAQARDADTSKSAVDASTSASPSANARAVKYCVVGKITGSRLPHKVCKTEKEWEASGYTLEELMK